MRNTKLLLTLFVLTFVLYLAQPAAAQAVQIPDQKNYNVSLRIVLGSNAGASVSEIPTDLSAVVGEIKRSFKFSNFGLVSSYQARIGGTGGAQYRSLGDVFNEKQSDTPSSFVDWKLSGLRSSSGALDPVNFQEFRFGSRVPIKLASNGPFQYESVGLELDRFAVTPGTPTLVGTLSSPKGDGMIFVILTVRPVESIP